MLEFGRVKKTMLPFKVRSVGLAGLDCASPVEQVVVGLNHVNMPQMTVEWKCVSRAHYSVSV